MSTRAVYTFEDPRNRIHVYKHCDGYPAGAVKAITAATRFAFTLPRFEADDFAAAFVAANKHVGGDVRLCGSQIVEASDTAPDAEYHYLITHGVNGLCLQIVGEGDDDSGDWCVLYSGPLRDHPDFPA